VINLSKVLFTVVYRVAVDLTMVIGEQCSCFYSTQCNPG